LSLNLTPDGGKNFEYEEYQAYFGAESYYVIDLCRSSSFSPPKLNGTE
jgi:hypothetical protein